MKRTKQYGSGSGSGPPTSKDSGIGMTAGGQGFGGGVGGGVGNGIGPASVGQT